MVNPIRNSVMEKIYTAIADAIANGAIYIYFLILYLLVTPVKKMLRKIGVWIAEGFNQEIFKIYEKRFDEKMQVIENHNNEKFEEINYKLNVLEGKIDHSINNKKYFNQMLDELKKLQTNETEN